MELRLGFGPERQREQRSLSITMRTPGHDLELALGFLTSEGVIHRFEDVIHIDHCTDEKGNATDHVVRVELHPECRVNWSELERHFYTSSSCGVCGKASLESLERFCPAPIASNMAVSPAMIVTLADKMREEQQIFEHTGGLHAAALFGPQGDLKMLREDVGRHNALDKVIGASVFQSQLPLSEAILVLSGRSCYELIQKAVMAGIPMVVSVGAPTSLAVACADQFGVTLVGFLKRDSFNVYSHPQRLQSK